MSSKNTEVKKEKVKTIKKPVVAPVIAKISKVKKIEKPVNKILEKLKAKATHQIDKYVGSEYGKELIHHLERYTRKLKRSGQ